VFSLGVIFYRMVYGCYPFEGEDEDDLISSIKKKKLKNIPTVSPLDIWISKEAHYLLISMLDYYPENRPSIDSLLDTSSLSFYV
jgi:serine/threonine protein kinase